MTGDRTTLATDPTILRPWLGTRGYVLAFVIFTVGMGISYLRRHDSDWDQCFVAAARILRAGGDIYHSPEARETGYVYPPLTAWLVVPFTYLPANIARFVWYLLNVLSILVLIHCAWRLAEGQGRQADQTSGWRLHLVALAGLACAGRYIHECLSHQQIDLVIGALLMGGCLLLSKRRDCTAGAAFGLGAAFKCTPLLWAPYLLLRRRWAAAVCLVAVAIGANLLPNALATPASGGWWLTDWARTYLAPMGSARSVPGSWASAIIYNQSLAGLVNRWSRTEGVWTDQDYLVLDRADPLNPGTIKLLVYGSELSLVGLAFVAALVGRRRAARSHESEPAEGAFEYSTVLLFMVLLSPMSSKPHFATLLLPAFCLARRALFHGCRASAAAVLASAALGLFTSRAIVGLRLSDLSMWYGSVTWSTLFLLAGCMWAMGHPSRPASVASSAACEPSPDRALAA